MEKKPTSGHVIGTNAQLQALRPELVKLGFVDDPEWNSGIGNQEHYTYMAVYGFSKDDKINYPDNRVINILHAGRYLYLDYHFYTIPENEAPEVSAKKIRDAYYAVNPE